MLTSIPAFLSAAVQDWQDTTLLPKDKGGIAETCTIYYAPTPSAIANPQLLTAGALVNTLFPTGDEIPPEDNPVDAMEFGQNFIEIEQSETIYMTVQWTPSTFNPKVYSGFKYQDGTIMTKGFVSDLQKVKNAEYMKIFQNAGFNNYSFKLVGEPVIPGQFTGSRYFYALWARS